MRREMLKLLAVFAALAFTGSGFALVASMEAPVKEWDRAFNESEFDMGDSVSRSEVGGASSPAVKTSEEALKLFVECYNTQNYDQIWKISTHPDMSSEVWCEKYAPMFQV
jgi:hypothetical protein